MNLFSHLNLRSLAVHCLNCLLLVALLSCPLQTNGQESNQNRSLEQEQWQTEWRTDTQLAVEAERNRFATEMNSLAEKARQLNLSAEATVAESQIVRFDADRQTIFMPGGMILPDQHTDESAADPANRSNDQKSFYRRLNRSKQEFAANLFVLVPKLVTDEKAADAYQLLHEILVYDPQHAEARRILGFKKHKRHGWIRSAKTTRAGKGRHGSEIDRLEKGKLLDSPIHHTSKFYSAPGEEAGLKLAAELERTYWVWRQVFFEYQSGTRQISEWLNNSGSDKFSSRQYEVYLFRDRQQYNRDLAVVSGIEQSTGYYDDKAKASFFYLDEDVQLATWRHETVHQLLQENAGAAVKAETELHAWLVEGVALYFETMKVYDHHVTLGGWDADRLQHARKRCKREGFFIPIETFDAITRKDLQARSDKGRVYSQAAGVAQMLMSAQQGRYRDNFVKFVRQFYRERRMKKTLAELTMPLDQLDRHYKAFLDVWPEQIRGTLTDPNYDKTQLKVLAIGRSGLTDEDMSLLQGCRNLDWMELSENRRITDIGLSSLFESDGPNGLAELYLDVTKITDDSAKTIASLRTLQVLDVATTQFGDTGLKRIAELPDMQILYMANTRLTDACIESLIKMPTLRLVDLRQTKVTDEAVQRLKAANPAVEVMR